MLHKRAMYCLKDSDGECKGRKVKLPLVKVQKKAKGIYSLSCCFILDYIQSFVFFHYCNIEHFLAHFLMF